MSPCILSRSAVLAVFSLMAVLVTGRAGDGLSLTPKGVACDMGNLGEIVLGIPALDGRNAHAAILADSVQIDGNRLTGRFGEPFDGVTLEMRLLGDGRVEYVYDSLPPDVKLVMCQFNLHNEVILDDVTVRLDQSAAVPIPVTPGKTNDDVRLLSKNGQKVVIDWPGGASLQLTSPSTCWFGVQDSRVWGKDFVGVCLTPPLKRDTPEGTRSTFVLTFGVYPAK